METARGLVIVVVVFHELWCVGSWLRVHNRAFVGAVLDVFCALCIQCPAHLLTFGGIVGLIVISAGGATADVIHRDSNGSLDTGVYGCGVDGKTSKAADAYNPYLIGLHIPAGNEIINRCREVLGIDVGRGKVARMSATLARKRGVEGERHEAFFGQPLGVKS